MASVSASSSEGTFPTFVPCPRMYFFGTFKDDPVGSENNPTLPSPYLGENDAVVGYWNGGKWFRIHYWGRIPSTITDQRKRVTFQFTSLPHHAPMVHLEGHGYTFITGRLKMEEEVEDDDEAVWRRQRCNFRVDTEQAVRYTRGLHDRLGVFTYRTASQDEYRRAFGEEGDGQHADFESDTLGDCRCDDCRVNSTRHWDCEFQAFFQDDQRLCITRWGRHRCCISLFITFQGPEGQGNEERIVQTSINGGPPVITRQFEWNHPPIPAAVIETAITRGEQPEEGFVLMDQPPIEELFEDMTEEETAIALRAHASLFERFFSVGGI